MKSPASGNRTGAEISARPNRILSLTVLARGAIFLLVSVVARKSIRQWMMTMPCSLAQRRKAEAADIAEGPFGWPAAMKP